MAAASSGHSLYIAAASLETHCAILSCTCISLRTEPDRCGAAALSERVAAPAHLGFSRSPADRALQMLAGVPQRWTCPRPGSLMFCSVRRQPDDVAVGIALALGWRVAGDESVEVSTYGAGSNRCCTYLVSSAPPCTQRASLRGRASPFPAPPRHLLAVQHAPADSPSPWRVRDPLPTAARASRGSVSAAPHTPSCSHPTAWSPAQSARCSPSLPSPSRAMSLRRLQSSAWR